MGRIFYWLKLKLDFFREKRIRKLRKQAGGDTYTVIYLEMLLLSLPDDGVLYFDGVENDFAEELALELYEEADDVRMTIAYLMAQGLMEQRGDGEYVLLQISEMIGKETESAVRMRRKREKLEEKRHIVTQSCDNVTGLRNNVQKCDTEIDIEKELETEKELHTEIDIDCEIYKGEYGNVILTDWQWERLQQMFPNTCHKRVDRLSRYIARTGKNYPSHYATIVNWAKENGYINAEAAKAAKEEEKKGSFDTDSFFDAALERSYAGMK